MSKKINTSERKDNPFPWATAPWKAIRDRLEIRSSDGLFCMSAREFVRQGKAHSPSKESRRAFTILIYLCKAGPHYQALVARRILEKASYKKGIIPKEAYDKSRTDNDFLRMYQVNPATLIRTVEDIKRDIAPVVNGRLKDESAIREAFKRVGREDFTCVCKDKDKEGFKCVCTRDMSQEEIEMYRRKGGFERIADLALFFWSCRLWIPYDTLWDLYYRDPKTKSARKELESLGDIYAYSSHDKTWALWTRFKGFIAVV